MSDQLTINEFTSSADTSRSEAIWIEKGKFAYEVWGTFVGTIQLQKCPGNANVFPNHGSAHWHVVTSGELTAPYSMTGEEGMGAWYRTQCTAYTSGTIYNVVGQ